MYEGRMLSPKLQQLFVGSIFRCKKVCHRESVLLFRPCFYIRFSVFHFFVPGVFSFFFFSLLPVGLLVLGGVTVLSPNVGLGEVFCRMPVFQQNFTF